MERKYSVLIDLVKKKYHDKSQEEIRHICSKKLKGIGIKLRSFKTYNDKEKEEAYLTLKHDLEDLFTKDNYNVIIEIANQRPTAKEVEYQVESGEKTPGVISSATLSNLFREVRENPDRTSLDLVAVAADFAGWYGYEQNIGIDQLFNKNSSKTSEDYKKVKEDSSLEYRRKLQLLGVNFIDENFINTLDLKNGTPQNFYSFSNPQWSDIILEYDIIRDQQVIFLKSINTLNSFQCKFYPIVSASGQGKSTFLKRIAYEQSKRDHIVLFWELHSPKSQEHLEKSIDIIKNYLSTIKDTVFLFIDNCFKINLETLLVQLEHYNIKIIGTSKIFEYDEGIEIFAYVQTKIEIAQLSIKELSYLKQKVQFLKLSNQSKNFNSKKYREFSFIISSIIPQNKFGLRLKKIINTLEEDKMLLDTFLIVCLFYKYGISVHLNIIVEFLKSKYSDINFSIEDLLLKIEKRVNGEIILTEEETLRLRHEKWADEGLKHFTKNQTILAKYYTNFLKRLDYSNYKNISFFIELFEKMINYQDGELAKKIFIHQEISLIFKSVEEDISSLFVRYFRLKKAMSLDSDHIIRKSLKGFLQKKVSSKSNYYVYTTNLDYLNLLEEKHKESKKEILNNFLRFSFYAEIKDFNMLWKYCVLNKKINLLKSIYTYKHQVDENNSKYTAILIHIHHLLKEEDNVDLLINRRFEKECQELKEVKLKYFICRREYKSAIQYANTFSEVDIRNKNLLGLCNELIIRINFDEGQFIIDKLKEEGDKKWLYLAIERYVYHNKKLELRQFLDFYSDKLNFNRKLLRRLWYFVAIATYAPNHAYHKYKGVRKWEKADRIIAQYDKFLPKIYFYLAKSGLRTLNTIGDSLYFFKESKEKGYLNREFDYPVRWVLTKYPKRLRDLFIDSRDKSFYIIRVVNSIIQYGELIGREESDTLINFFLNHIESEQSENWNNYNYLEAYLNILQYKNRTEEVKELILNIDSLFPEEPKSYSLLANYYENSTDDLQKAEEYYLKAKKINNDKYAIHIYNLALFYIRNRVSSKMEEARELLIEANGIGRNIPLLESSLKKIERIEKENNEY